MDAELGRIYIKLETIDKATAQIQKAQKAAEASATKIRTAYFQMNKDLEKRTKETTKEMGTAFTIVGTAIIASMALAVKSFADTGDQLKKMSDRTGISVESLSKLSYVANLGGVSIEELNVALNKMSKTILDAAYGLQTSERALNMLGLTIKDLEKLSPEERFLKIAEGLSKIQDKSVQAAVAQEVFGRAGAKLIPFLSKGAVGIRELYQEAEKLGIVMSAEDAVAAEKFNDEITKLTATAKRLYQEVGRQLIPELSKLLYSTQKTVDEFMKWKKENPELFRSIVEVTSKVGLLVLGMGSLLLLIPKITTASATCATSIRLLTAALAANPIIAATIATAVGIKLIADSIENEIDMVNNSIDAENNLEKKLKSLTKAQKADIAIIDERIRKLKESGDPAYANAEDERRVAIIKFSEENEKLIRNQKERAESILQAAKRSKAADELEIARIETKLEKEKKVLSIKEKDAKTQEDIYTKALDAYNNYISGFGSIITKFQNEKAKEYKRIEQEELVFAQRLNDKLYKQQGVVSNLTDEYDKATNSLKINNDVVKDAQDESEKLNIRIKETENNLDDLSKAVEAQELSLKKWLDDVRNSASILMSLSDMVNANTARGFEEQRRQVDMTYDAQVKAAEEAGKDTMAIEEERSAKIREINRRQADEAKKIAKFQTVVNTAAAVMKVIATSGNLLEGVAVGLLGASQLYAIDAEPLPALAQGGLAYGPTTAMIGDNVNAALDPEVVAPLSKLKDMLNEGTQNIAIYLDGTQITKTVVRGMPKELRLIGVSQ